MSEIDFRQIFELVSANKWIILAVAVACFAFGAFYCLVGSPTYIADGLVQVEDSSKNSALTSTLSDLSSLLLGGTVETEAEIQILQSRMVLDQVINKMNLLIVVRPRRFPLVGSAIARWNELRDTPVSAPLGLSSYAWGGEKINVTAFDVPDDLLGKEFTLVSTATGYALEDPSGRKILEGQVGERAGVDLKTGRLEIFVRTLTARPNTVFGLTRRARQDVIKDLSGRLTVAEQGKQSGIIQLQFRGGSSNDVAGVVNEIENAYLLQNVERRSAEAQQSLEFLDTQLPELKKKVDVAQANLNNYELHHGTVDVTQETEQVLQTSVDLEAKRLDLLQERQQALQRFTPEHPAIKSIDEQIRVIGKAQDSAKKSIAALPTTQQDVFGLMRDLDVATQLYTAMQDTVQQLQVAKAGTIGNVRIVDRPLKPFRPSSPNPIIVLPVALFLGIFLGISAVFVQRSLLSGVDDPSDIEHRFGLITFAAIPYSQAQRRVARKMLGGGDGQYVLVATNDDELVAEALRSLRTSLHFALLESPNNVLMITGPSPGIGKSFISVNLAAVLAISGKRVVIVDADLRRGHLHRYFNAEATPGVTDFVAKDADEIATVRATSVDGLHYVSRGTIPPNPAELLLNERFDLFIKHLSATYDYVILDSPPVLPIADAAIVGRMAGCTLLALKSAEHSMREIEETLKRLANARISVRGVVFNQVGGKFGSYGYGNYGYTYYRYGNS